MAHVHRPSRLTLVSDCVSASGTVAEVKFEAYDGDYKVFVVPDPQYADLLVPSNNGLLLVEVIPTDQPSVFLPAVGQHATFYGALVNDKGHDGWVEIHPAWLITTLDVAVNVASSVAVGDQLGISISVNSTVEGTSRPVPQVNLFLEMVSDKGTAVRWEAAQTNTLGAATLNLVSLESAGDYTLWVYASKDHETGFGKAPVTIRRR